jgi:hypothetical protein
VVDTTARHRQRSSLEAMASAADGPPVNAGQLGGGHRSAVEQIFQDGSCTADAYLATEIDIRRNARPAVPKLVCGISRRQSSPTIKVTTLFLNA